MLTVSRPCHIRLTAAAWVVLWISLITIIAAMATSAWVVQHSSGASHAITDCCSKFTCIPSFNSKEYMDTFFSIGLLGFFVSVTGAIASLVFTLCNRQLTCINCYYFIATVVLLGGILLLSATIFFAANVLQNINSIISANCGVSSSVGLGNSFGAFVVGSVGILIAALPLFCAIPRARQPIMIGEFVAVESPATDAAAAHPQSQPQSAESRVVPTTENAQLIRMRSVGFSAQPSANHRFDFWDGPRVAPSAPECDIFFVPTHAISEQPELQCPIPEPLEIQYETTEICSVSEQPTLHFQTPDPPEAEYETLDEMNSYLNITIPAVTSYANCVHSETGRRIPEFSAANSDFSEEYCLTEQPEHSTSEQPDEYVTVEETRAEFDSASQSEAMYTNLEHPEQECATWGHSTSNSAVSERPQSEYNNMKLSEAVSCSVEQPATVMSEQPGTEISEQSEVEYVTVD